MRQARWSMLWLLALAPVVRGGDMPVTKDANGLFVLTRVRYYPAPGQEQALVGGKLQGSNRSELDGFETLAEIKEAPAAGQWSELTFGNSQVYRWVRYKGPAGSYGRVA
ncbi:MAG: hypothetical protein P4L84_17710 [Isosphaeraceae bacterium]|nr:hypothetical protein [Isosphaeraceae bacterium]